MTVLLDRRSAAGHAARVLASGRTHAIGVVTLGTNGYGVAGLLIAVKRAVREAGYAFRAVSTMADDPAGVAGAVASLLGQGVDGIVISEPIDHGRASVRVDVPVLFLGTPPTFAADRTITAGVGAEPLARAATGHLLDLGHATVHHLAGPQGWYAARDRLRGWHTTLEVRGRRVPPVVEGDWSAASGYAAGRRLARDPDVTAVFAAGDEMAIGLIHALREAGRRVPEDVSVVGFDDMPIAAHVRPALTTARQPFDAAAREGLGLLLHAIQRPHADSPPVAEPPVELVVRASSSVPPPRPGGAGPQASAGR